MRTYADLPPIGRDAQRGRHAACAQPGSVHARVERRYWIMRWRARHERCGGGRGGWRGV